MIGDWSCGGLNVLGDAYCLANSNDDTTTVVNTEPEDLSEKLLLLSWRDPRKTGSDWTIVVVTNSDTDDEEEEAVEAAAATTTTYHVHKRILSVGPRSSRYFANVFHNEAGRPQQHRYNQSQSTRITLDAHDAASFPVLLDFMYDPTYQQQQQQQNSGTGDNEEEEEPGSMGTFAVAEDLTPVHGVSLRHLARVFACEGLMVAVTKWIHHDMSGHTGPVYYVQAQVYGDDELFESAKRFCLEQFVQLETKTLLQLPLALFRSLIVEVINTTTTQHLRRSSSTTSSNSNPSKSKTSNYDYTDGNNNEEPHIAEEKATATNDVEDRITTVSSHVSEVVCQYFETHPERLTVPVLLELTSPTVMPYIAAESAIGLTALIRRDVHPHDLPHHHPQDGDDDPDDDDWPRFVTLCARCAQAVVRQYGWKEFNIAAAVEEYVYGPSLCGDARAGGATGRARLESLFFATSFSAALDRAQQEANQSEETSRSGSMTKKQQRETLQQHNEDLVWQNQKLKEEVDQYKSVLAGTNEELLMLRSQVKHLKHAAIVHH